MIKIFIKKIVIIFYNLQNKIFGRLLYDRPSRRVLDLDKQRNLNTINTVEIFLNNSTFKLSNQHPYINAFYSKELFEISPLKAFNEIKNFETIKLEWSKKNPKFKTNFDYLPFEKIAGAIGNYSELFNYLKYRFNIENKKTKPKIIVADKKQITNQYLFKHFENYIDLIENPRDFNQKKFIVEVNKMAIDVASIFNGKYYPHPFAANFVNQKLKKVRNKTFHQFRLSVDDLEYGFKNLEKVGINKKDWYVLFHIRDGKGDECRNSKPETYLRAMKNIINKGGWVIRVGRHEKFRFPKIDRLFDYSFSEIANDRMDIFLAATCKFCVGTSSGYAPIPKYFGKPLLLTNCLPVAAYLELNNRDIFLPKKLIDKKTKRKVNFKNYFGFPINYFTRPNIFIKNELEIINNSQEDLEKAVDEMFNLNIGNPSSQFLNKNSLFRKKLKDDLEKDFDFPLEHECNFSETLINQYL